MIKSMTGFGKGESNGKFGQFRVEIRTVNHRYFDVSIRMPNSLALLEDRVKNYIHRYIKRGKVNFSLLHRIGDKDIDLIKLNDEAIEKYYKMVHKIRKNLRLKDDIKLSHILSFPDIIIQEQPDYNANSMWPVLEKAVHKAIVECDRMRLKEGQSLYKDLEKRIKRVSNHVHRIAQGIPCFISEYKTRLDSRIKDLLKDSGYAIDKSRLATELAIFVRQCDVSEEITRAKSHLNALRSALTSHEEAGRKLDFILQELQREINTLGSKAGSVKISRSVISIKSEIEKMREQAQNVE